MQSLADRSVRSLAARFAARRDAGASRLQPLPADVVPTGLRAERRAPRHQQSRRRLHRRGSSGAFGKFAGFCLACFSLAVGYGAFHLAYPERTSEFSLSGIGTAIDRAAAHNGFSVAQIALMGHDRASDKEIYRALKIGHAGSVFTYDTVAGCRRVEELAWVKTCRIARVLPDQLDVQITERKPFAVWQRRGMYFLIDQEGRTLEPVPPRSFKRLPLVIGEGASTAAAEIVRHLDAVPDVLAELHSIERVAQRRWSLNLKRGTKILLPAMDAKTSVGRLAAMKGRTKLLKSAPRVLDLRLVDRISIRPAAQSRIKQASTREGGV